MTEKSEWDKVRDRIKENAKRVDVKKERDAFEAWQEQCGQPIEPRYHDDETGYRDTSQSHGIPGSCETELARQPARGAAMKLKNYRPLMLRQVEYFGETITIPTDCEWVATGSRGGVMAWRNKPDTQRGYWECSDDTGIEIPFFVGEFDPIDEDDAIKTLRHYPIGED